MMDEIHYMILRLISISGGMSYPELVDFFPEYEVMGICRALEDLEHNGYISEKKYDIYDIRDGKEIPE